jgi:heat shock protein HslJ
MGKIKLFFVIITAAVILVMVFAGVSCTASVDNELAKLTGVTWVLQSYGDSGDLTPVAPGGEDVTLTFHSDDNSYNGFGGVNFYGGDYKVDGDKLTIGDIISTQLLGQEPLMGQEITYYRILQAAQTYQITGEMLTITGTEGILVFTKKK